MINIIEKKSFFFALSGLLFVASVYCIITLGFKPGIDFTGGTLLEIVFTQERPGAELVRTELSGIGFENAIVQPTDTNGFLLKLPFITEDEHQQILGTLRETLTSTRDTPLSVSSADVEVELSTTSEQADALAAPEENKLLEQSIETIGPSVSRELKNRAWKAGVAVIIAIIVFLAYSFRKVSRPISSWAYGVCAIIALVHDIVITMGVFAILGTYAGVEVDIPFVVALLTILGFSVHDTIVVFDRIREKLIKHGASHFADTVNRGVNDTITRSINTSFTVLLVLGALFFFGGDSIHYFSLALIIGIFFGTYSSMFLASPLLVVWERFKHKQI